MIMGSHGVLSSAVSVFAGVVGFAPCNFDGSGSSPGGKVGRNFPLIFVPVLLTPAAI